MIPPSERATPPPPPTTPPTPALTPTWLLGFVSMIPPAGVSMHIAANAALAAQFGVAPNRIDLLVPAFLWPFAVGMIGWGAMANWLGARRALLVSLVGFTVASAAAAAIALATASTPTPTPPTPTLPLPLLPSTFGLLLVARVAQGLTAAGAIVLPRAIIAGERTTDAASTMGMVAALQALSPTAAPIVGSLILALGVPMVFAALGTLSLLAAVAVAAVSANSVRARQPPPVARAGPGGANARWLTRRFVVSTAGATAVTGIYFGLVAGGVADLGARAKMPVTWLLGMLAAAAASGSFFGSRLRRSAPESQAMALGCALVVGGVVAALLLPGGRTRVLALLGYGFGSGIALPGFISAATRGARNAASQAGILSAAQYLIGGAAGVVVATHGLGRWAGFQIVCVVSVCAVLFAGWSAVRPSDRADSGSSR